MGEFGAIASSPRRCRPVVHAASAWNDVGAAPSAQGDLFHLTRRLREPRGAASSLDQIRER